MNSTKSSDAQRQPKANLPHAKLKLNEKQICFVLFHISLINPSKEIKVCISSHSSHRVSNCPSHSFHCLSYSSHSFRCPCHCVSHCTHTSLISRYPSLQKKLLLVVTNRNLPVRRSKFVLASDVIKTIESISGDLTCSGPLFSLCSMVSSSCSNQHRFFKTSSMKL